MRQAKPLESMGIGTPPYYRKGFWSRFAWLYDSLVGLGFLPLGGERKFRERFMGFAGLIEGQKVLDVCCGTGGLTSLLANRVGDGGVMIGVDLSPGMIKIAERKTRHSGVSFQAANSEHLPFPEDMFDSSFISLALHEMPETARRNTLKEIYRILKDGGSLFVLDYGLPRGAFAWLVMRAFVAVFEDEYAYRMLTNGSLAMEIQEAGLAIQKQEAAHGGMFQMIGARKVAGGTQDG